MKQTKARKLRLEKLVTERTAYWKKKRPGWITAPVAVIEQPLKKIYQRCTEKVMQEDGTELKTTNPVFYMALDFARNGDGYSVKTIAKTLLSI